MAISTSQKRGMRLILQMKSQQTRRPNAFTLVELLVVISIVEYFLQLPCPTSCHKPTKPKRRRQNATRLDPETSSRQVPRDGEDPEDTSSAMTTAYGAPAEETTLFDYAAAGATPSFNDPVYSVTATANGTDQGLGSKGIRGCVNFDTGVIDIGSNLADTVEAVDCGGE